MKINYYVLHLNEGKDLHHLEIIVWEEERGKRKAVLILSDFCLSIARTVFAWPNTKEKKKTQ